jgi:proteasome accessory factor A
LPEHAAKLLVDADGAPMDRIIGFETEYGLQLRYSNSVEMFSPPVGFVKKRLDSNCAADEYKQDGTRQYEDVGEHPELSTEEDTDFLGAAWRKLSGHLKISRCFADEPPLEMPSGKPMPRLKLTVNTTDAYNNSWGSHINILASSKLPVEDYVGALLAHRVSRIVWSGAGHVMRSPKEQQWQFCLSEKAEHIWEEANNCTTNRRPLVNLREEALADSNKYRRIHDVAGESIFSPHANALLTATESIILRACELGVDFSDLVPEEPVQAIRDISRGADLTTKIRLANGSAVTAIDLQTAIRERAVKAAQKADYLTPQEKEWAEKWAQLLNDLKYRPDSCMDRVDWKVKKAYIDKALDKRKKGMPAVAVAQQAALGYHQLLPVEGKGMQLLRRGFYEDSPLEDVLEQGLELPDTRAKLRAKAIAYFRKLGLLRHASWESLRVGTSEFHSERFMLYDPYATEDEDLSHFIDRLAI